MMNRKIIKSLLSKVLGPYDIFSSLDEQNVIAKYRKSARNKREELNEVLDLYDEEDRGVIGIMELKDALGSVEVYDGKDKRSLECFTICMLKRNHNSTQLVKLKDVRAELFPEIDVTASSNT